jgi:hypothetical protein
MDRMTRMAVDSKKKKGDLVESLLRDQFTDNLGKMVVDRNQMFSKDEVVALMEKGTFLIVSGVKYCPQRIIT